MNQASTDYTDDDIIGRVPIARFASPDAIARAILFLADPAQNGFLNYAAHPRVTYCLTRSTEFTLLLWKRSA